MACVIGLIFTFRFVDGEASLKSENVAVYRARLSCVVVLAFTAWIWSRRSLRIYYVRLRLGLIDYSWPGDVNEALLHAFDTC